MNSLFYPYAKQSIDDTDRQSVNNALHADLITRGPPVENFEQAIADYCSVPYAVVFNSGTTALMAAYFAGQISTYDHLFSTPNTFIATVGPAIKLGIEPYFIDIDRRSGNISLDELIKTMAIPFSRGRIFIVPVHFSGIAIDMMTLHSKIKDSETFVIEDASHALGSNYPSGEKVGCCLYSHITIFSFHPAKILTTGEGGMALTRDKNLYHKLKLFRDNGIERREPYLKSPPTPGYYEVHAITGNYNFTSFQAALGLSQFQKLENFVLKRRMLIKRYRHHLQKIAQVTLFSDEQDDFTAFALFVIQIDFSKFHISREKVMEALKEKGIGSQVHYIPLYYHPVIKKKEDHYLTCHENETYYQQALSLPLYYDLSESDVDWICEQLLMILNSNN